MCVGCPAGYTHVSPTGCYMLELNTQGTQDEANSFCVQHGGTLANLDVSEEYNIVRSWLRSTCEFYPCIETMMTSRSPTELYGLRSQMIHYTTFFLIRTLRSSVRVSSFLGMCLICTLKSNSSYQFKRICMVS